MNIRPEVQQFAEAMEKKLRKNDYKLSWEEDSDTDLIHKLIDEVDELDDALCFDGDVQDEAVDVANFAMMLWCRHEA